MSTMVLVSSASDRSRSLHGLACQAEKREVDTLSTPSDGQVDAARGDADGAYGLLSEVAPTSVQRSGRARDAHAAQESSCDGFGDWPPPLVGLLLTSTSPTAVSPLTPSTPSGALAARGAGLVMVSNTAHG